MIEIAVAVGVFWTYCGLMSLLARGEPVFLQNSVVQVGSITLFVFLLCWAGFAIVANGGHPIIAIPGSVLVAFFGFLLGYFYVAFLISETTDRAHRSLTGINSMKVEKTYDKIEKLEHEKKFEDALDGYAEAAARDPKDAEARRRAGDICLKIDRPEEAVRWFRQAIPLMESTEDRVTLSFRMAEVLRDHLDDREQARRILEDVAADHFGTKFEEYAQKRLEKL